MTERRREGKKEGWKEGKREGNGSTAPGFLRPGMWRMLGRALLLRCPHCGGRGIFASLFELKKHCSRCGMRLDRGESDYFLGAYLFNLIAVELILFFVVCGFVYVSWPDPNWDLITWVTAVLMLSGCMLCYPFSKTTWLAVDLVMRPMTQEELDGAVMEK